MSIKSIVKINEELRTNNKPSGWIVRELYDSEKKRSILFELGIYVNDTTFLGVPLHYSFKNKLIPMTNTYNDEFNYYLMDDVEVGLSTFKNKKGKVFPVFVEPSEKHPAVKVACIALSSVPNKVINAFVKRKDNVVVRDYIDKERNSIAVVIACTDTDIVNPSIEFDVTIATIGSTYLSTKSFNIGIEPSISTDSNTVNEPIKTEFIRFNRFIKRPRVKAVNEVDNKETSDDNIVTNLSTPDNLSTEQASN